jgi:hypothetical protein
MFRKVLAIEEEQQKKSKANNGTSLKYLFFILMD